MRISDISWDEGTIAHLARHGVEPEEVEGVFFKADPYTLKTRQNRYLALGQTQSGRYLAIVFEYFGQYKAKIITARPMSEAERKLYKRR